MAGFSIEDQASVLTYVFANCLPLTTELDDDALAELLHTLIDPSYSENAGLFFDVRLDLNRRLLLIEAMTTVFTSLFPSRCSPSISFNAVRSPSAINTACYMWWDVFPYRPMNSNDDLFRKLLAAAELGLYSANCAVIEASIHGLGHWYRYCPMAVEPVFMRLPDKLLPPELQEYATEASTGKIE